MQEVINEGKAIVGIIERRPGKAHDIIRAPTGELFFLKRKNPKDVKNVVLDALSVTVFLMLSSVIAYAVYGWIWL